jgi:hypothetical protein
MNQILIVTCNRDRWQFLLQCKSIGKFLAPCRVNIIINQYPAAEWQEWFSDQCQPHLARHEVTVLTYEDFLADFSFVFLSRGVDGWVTQQILKLVFAIKTKQDYLVLDSKNWFVKPCCLLDFTRRTRKPGDHNPNFNPIHQDCCRRWNLDQLTAYRPAITPYFIDPVIVGKLFQDFGGIDNFLAWFLKFKNPSEFIVYDLFAQSIAQESAPGETANSPCRNFYYAHTTMAVEHKSTELNLLDFAACLQNPSIKMITASIAFMQDPAVRQAVEQLLPLD